MLGVVAIYAMSRTSNLGDYSLGGRSLSSSVTALSAGASDMSGWLLLGLPGAVYLSGLVEGWILVGLIAGAWINWTYVANRLRVASTLYGDALTIPQVLSLRTSANGKTLAVVASLAMIVFFTVYVSAGFIASAKLFETVLGLDYTVALLIGVLIVMSYTAIGGFLAVCWTDAFQALLMLLVLVAVPMLALGLGTDGGSEPIANEVWNLDQYSFIGVLGLLAWGLGYFGQPHILTRFMAIHDANAIKSARTIGMSWMLVTSFAALAVGYAAMFALPDLSDPETALIRLSELVFNPWIAGIVVAAILAAVMSTVDSQLMVLSTALVNDVINPSSKQLIYSRICVIVVAAAAALFALDPDSQIFGTVGLAWAGIGSSFGSCILFSLFYRRTTSQSLIAAIVAGTATTLIWHNLEGGIFDVYALLPAFCAASIVLYAAARARPDKKAEENFELLEQELGLRPTA